MDYTNRYGKGEVVPALN